MSSDSPAPIRVVLVEDHDMVAEAIGIALGQADGIDVVARAESITSALDGARTHEPDVIILDRRLPDGDGLGVIGELGSLGARVLVLTGEATTSVAARVVEAGGAGLMLKTAKLEELVAAVRKVAAGEVAFAADLLPDLLGRLAGRNGPPGSALTRREQETLVLLAGGTSTAEIGERMGVAHNTARNHVQRVLEKLGARSKLEAVAIARREGLLD
jgi:DNA-binding NarL/FixJ family response regulator